MQVGGKFPDVSGLVTSDFIKADMPYHIKIIFLPFQRWIIQYGSARLSHLVSD